MTNGHGDGPSRVARVVVVGGSAGSWSQLQTILSGLPRPLRTPVIVAVHRGRGTSGANTMADSLTRPGGIPVVEIEDLMAYGADRVMLAPAGYNTLIGRTGPVLVLEPFESPSTPSIDALFESAADTFGDGVVAVVLSCANTDGLAGVRSVMAAGGRVLAVSPQESAFAVLVQAAARIPGVEVVGLSELVATMAIC